VRADKKEDLGLDHHDAVQTHPVDDSEDVDSRLIQLLLLLQLLALVDVK